MLDKVGILICTTENRLAEANFIKKNLHSDFSDNVVIEIVRDGENVAMTRNRFLIKTKFEYVCFIPINYLVMGNSSWINALYECFHMVAKVGMVGLLNHSTHYNLSQILTYKLDLLDVHYSIDNTVDGIYMIHVPTMLLEIGGFEQGSEYAPYIDFILNKKFQVKEFNCFYIQNHFAFSYRMNDNILVPRKTKEAYTASLNLLKNYAKQKHKDEI